MAYGRGSGAQGAVGWDPNICRALAGVWSAGLQIFSTSKAGVEQGHAPVNSRALCVSGWMVTQEAKLAALVENWGFLGFETGLRCRRIRLPLELFHRPVMRHSEVQLRQRL